MFAEAYYSSLAKRLNPKGVAATSGKGGEEDEDQGLVAPGRWGFNAVLRCFMLILHYIFMLV